MNTHNFHLRKLQQDSSKALKVRIISSIFCAFILNVHAIEIGFNCKAAWTPKSIRQKEKANDASYDMYSKMKGSKPDLAVESSAAQG